MTKVIATFLLVLPIAVLAQTPNHDSVDLLIKQLGDSKFRSRQTAMEALKKRPEAAAVLRKAMRSADLETRRRIGAILEYHDRQPVRDLQAAVKAGRVDRFVELFSALPAGKYDEDASFAFRDLVQKIVNLHHKQAGAKIELSKYSPYLRTGPLAIPILRAKRITEDTRCPDERLLLRIEELDWDHRRQKPRVPAANTFAEQGSLVVASGKAHMSLIGGGHVIIAGGSVCLDGPAGAANTVIISRGDVTLGNTSLGNSLIIARGNVMTGGSYLVNCRIIGGGKVSHPRKMENTVITENDSNPLGFIRWSDASKEKRVPKRK